MSGCAWEVGNFGKTQQRHTAHHVRAWLHGDGSTVHTQEHVHKQLLIGPWWWYIPMYVCISIAVAFYVAVLSFLQVYLALALLWQVTDSHRLTTSVTGVKVHCVYVHTNSCGNHTH